MIILNKIEFLTDLSLIFQRVFKNAIISDKFLGNDYHYLIISGVDYLEEPPLSYDVLQLEQMEHFVFKIPLEDNLYIKLLKGAKVVYEWSKFNITCLEANFGLTNLQHINIYQRGYNIYNFKKNNYKYNAVFIGTMNNRRKNILDYQEGTVNIFSNINNEEKTKILKLSKIAINIHFYENAVLEIERIIECLKNKCLVISEYSKDNELDKNYESMVLFVNSKEELKEKLNYYLSNESARLALFDTFYTNFLNKEMAQEVSQVPLDLKDSFPIKRRKFNYAEIIKDKNDYTLVQKKFPLVGDMPPVSLITITKNREKFFPLMINNYMNFTYPFDKIEWIILEDGDNNNEEYFKKYKNIKYVYAGRNYYNNIADKRNAAIKLATNNIICHLDDDDFYFKNSLYLKVKKLMEVRKQDILCVGTIEIAVYNMVNNCSYLINGNTCGEATLCFYKEFWEQRGFSNNYNGEGYEFIYGREDKVLIIPYYFNIIVINHKENYTGKTRMVDINTNNIYSLFDMKTKEILLNIRAPAA
jgi:hypothetical protein